MNIIVQILLMVLYEVFIEAGGLFDFKLDLLVANKNRFKVLDMNELGDFVLDILRRRRMLEVLFTCGESDGCVEHGGHGEGLC